MLTFSQQQIDIFANHQDQLFINDMVTYLRSCAGKQADNIFDKTFETEVRLLIDKAKAYGYSNHQDVYYFIEVALICGEDFETNPQYQWLTDNLKRNNPQELVPVKQLYDAVLRTEQIDK